MFEWDSLGHHTYYERYGESWMYTCAGFCIVVFVFYNVVPTLIRTLCSSCLVVPTYILTSVIFGVKMGTWHGCWPFPCSIILRNKIKLILTSSSLTYCGTSPPQSVIDSFSQPAIELFLWGAGVTQSPSKVFFLLLSDNQPALLHALF